MSNVELKYCVNCLYPETKPEIWFDKTGLCSACLNFEARAEIDWDARAKAFDQSVRVWSQHQGGVKTPTVIVPVSGGKDSTAQVAKCQDMGYRVIAVNARTDLLSDLGRRNLDNIGRMCDVVEFHPNDALRRKIMRLALKEVGDWSWPEHVLIHTIPFRAADMLNVPVIVYGELAQNEYGAGPKWTGCATEMTRQWVEEFAGLLGLRVDDVQTMTGASDGDMDFYRFPQPAKATALWMGQFFPWDGYENYQTALSHGFETYITDVEGSWRNYENLDNHATGPRDYFRYLKYGYGRATDIVSNWIRRGRLTREEGVQIVQERDGAFPWTCLGKPLDDILGEIGLTIGEFRDACDAFTNWSLFAQPPDGDTQPTPLFKVR